MPLSINRKRQNPSENTLINTFILTLQRYKEEFISTLGRIQPINKKKNCINWIHTSSCGIFLSFSASILTLTTPDLSTISWISFPFFPITFPTERTYRIFHFYGLPQTWECCCTLIRQDYLCTSSRTCPKCLKCLPQRLS